MTLLALVKGAFVTCLALAATAAAAQAGSYHVYSCRTPVGESAPADGWSGSAAGSAYAEDTCQQPGGALLAALGEAKRTANTDIATWAFEAPVGESIAGATLWRAGDADGGAAINAAYEFWLAGPAETDIFDECDQDRRVPVKATPRSPCPAKTAWSCPPPTWARESM